MRPAFANPVNGTDIFKSQVSRVKHADFERISRYVRNDQFNLTPRRCTGYGDSAVKLQRDWMADPQGLPFAQFMKSHALVTLVQKGLLYHEIEKSLEQVMLHSNPNVETESLCLSHLLDV